MKPESAAPSGQLTKTPAWEAVFFAALTVAPFMFGSVYPWAYGLLEVGVLAALLLLLWRGAWAEGPQRVFWGWGLACLAGLVFLAGLQLVPLPPALVELLAPGSYAMWQSQSLPTAQAAPALLPLSLYPFATADQGLLLLTCLVATVLAALATRRRQGARTGGTPFSFVLLLGIGFLLAAVAIIQLGLDAKAIYGFFKPRHSYQFLGPYVNYNHFAGYMAMVVPLGMSLLARELFRSRRRTNHGRMLVVGIALVVMMAAVFLSRSRGGVITLLLVMALQVVLLLAIGRAWRMNRYTVGLVLCLVLLLGVSSQITDWSRTLPRFHTLFHQNPTDSLRWKLYTDVARMGNQLPLTGAGLGTFSVAYPAYKTLNRQGLFNHAHNDYLEYLAEMGWPGLLLFLGFAAWVLARGGRVILLALSRRARGDPALIERALLVTGSLGGVAALLIHGLTDFNLRIPANALTWFALCGITLGLARWDATRSGD